MSVLQGISDFGTTIIGLLRSGVSRDLSANSILTALRGEGLGYRRTTFLSDIRILREAEQTWSRIRYVTKKSVPSESHYLTAQRGLITEYQTVVEIRGYNTETGEESTKHVTVGHDTLLTRGELEDKAVKESKGVSPTFIIFNVMLVQARKTLRERFL